MQNEVLFKWERGVMVFGWGQADPSAQELMFKTVQTATDGTKS